MISVVIPTLNAEQGLAAALTALIPAVVEGLVKEVIIVDGGSRDRTLKIADQAGARVIKSMPGRGAQLDAGAKAAHGIWLMFLHADTVLETGWEREVGKFCDRITTGELQPCAAAFRYALDDDAMIAGALETAVGMRSRLFGMPFGDQGLLMTRDLYRQIGGYKPIALMEDVDIARRLGRKRIKILRARALTSAARYKRDGYVRRIARNQACLILYALGVAPDRIIRVYSPTASHDGKEAIKSP